MSDDRIKAGLAVCVGVLGFGGTCSEPPAWHDLSGGWVNASWGPAGTVEVEGAGRFDVDVALTLAAAVPRDRTPLPVTGTVCIIEGAGLGLAGTYNLDPEASTWAGSDYGGARLDLVARASDGRRITISQAFMYNASPDELKDAILAFAAADGTPTHSVRFEGFRRSREVTCP